MCLGWFAAATRRGLRHHLGRAVGCHPRARPAAPSASRLPDGFVPAGQIVLATGAWANDLLRPLGAEQPIELRRLQVLVGRTDPGGAASLRGLLGRGDERRRPPRPGRQFCAVAYAGEDLLERADDCDHGLSGGYEDAVRRGLRTRYPRLAGFELVRGFAGPYDVTPDWNPIIGPCPGVDGLYLAVGWSGHGFKLSPAVGEVVAAEVTGRHAADRRRRAATGAVRRGPAAAARLRARRPGLAFHDGAIGSRGRRIVRRMPRRPPRRRAA